MANATPRIAVGGFMHESNTFSPYPTERRTQLQRLAGLGELIDARALPPSRRDPVSSFNYLTTFERRKLLSSITLTDSGTIDFLSFREWDQRQLK